VLAQNRAALNACETAHRSLSFQGVVVDPLDAGTYGAGKPICQQTDEKVATNSGIE
jgi:hypothetical protein